MPERVDYDAIAATYNRRFTNPSRSGILLSLLELIETCDAERILEVGCGTGHWLAGLSGLACEVYGLDASAGMLAQAQQAGNARVLVQGRAEDLPFRDGSFDLVYCVHAIHHFQGQGDFVEQAYRVLKSGGVLAVFGMDPRHHREDWYVYQYFDGTFDTDLARYPSWGSVLDWMTDAGFERMELRLAEEVGEPKYGSVVLEDPFLGKNACSQLSLLTDQAYTEGVSRIRAVLAEAEVQGGSLVFQNTIRIHRLAGWVARAK